MRFKQAKPSKITASVATNYRLYSPSAMTSAYRAVKEDRMSVRRAATQYAVPQTTLRQWILGRVDPETTGSGPSPLFSQEEEAVFVEHLKSMAQLGYGYTRSEVVDMASNYAVFLRKRDRNHPFSLKWFRCFMRRWPEMKIRKPRALSRSRAKSASQEAVTDYFNRLNEVLIKYGLKDKPEAIYNVDEKGIQTEHSPPYIVTGEESTPAITSERSTITTIIGCGNALGTQIPPYFVFKGVRMSADLMEGSSAGSNATMTPSGWSNSSVFLTYCQAHFVKYIQRQNEQQPILLIFDGHKSHVNVALVNWAKQHNIILFVLPAHTSHVLQPLDVGCFGPLQRIYNSECHKFMRDNPSSKITRYNVSSLSSKAYLNALSPSNLKAAFARTGIYPFDASVVTPVQLAPADVYTSTSQAVNEIEQAHAESYAHESQAAECEITEESTPVKFFVAQNKCIEKKKSFECNQRKNNISKVISGTSITEPDIYQKLVDHEENKGKNKFGKHKSAPAEPKAKKPKISVNIKSQQPGPSGLQVIPLTDSDSDDSLSDDTAEEDKCCVCKRFQPKELHRCQVLVFTKWAKCDLENCDHWTHLKYCCKQTVVRRHTTFVCPCHQEE